MQWARIHPNASYPAHVENTVQDSQVIWPHVYFQLTRCDHLDSISAIHKIASSQKEGPIEKNKKRKTTKKNNVKNKLLLSPHA